MTILVMPRHTLRAYLVGQESGNQSWSFPNEPLGCRLDSISSDGFQAQGGKI